MFGPLNPQASAISGVMMPISTVRCFQIRLLVSSVSRSSTNTWKVSAQAAIRSSSPAGRSLDTPPGRK